MLGVIAEHAVPSDEPLPQDTGVHASRTISTESLARKTERIANGGSKQEPRESLHAKTHEHDPCRALDSGTLGADGGRDVVEAQPVTLMAPNWQDRHEVPSNSAPLQQGKPNVFAKPIIFLRPLGARFAAS
jgi:hypothetical protein